MNTLSEKLHFAARNNMQAEEVKIMIGETPQLDTKKERDRNSLKIADLELNEVSEITVTGIKNALRVIYWKIEDQTNQASIAGLAWLEKDEATFFSGKVLDP